MSSKTYTIKKSRWGKTTIEHTGTLEELILFFSYTLECGVAWQHEKGNKPVVRNPKTIHSLVINLNKAAANTCRDYTSESYHLVTE